MKNIVDISLVTDIFDFYCYIKEKCCNTAILESLGDVNLETSRYSIIGVEAEEELWEYKGDFFLTNIKNQSVHSVVDWLELLDAWCGPVGVNKDVFQTGTIGYIGYEMNRQFENITKTENVKCPVSQVRLTRYSLLLVYDRVSRKSFWVADNDEVLSAGKVYEKNYFETIKSPDSSNYFYMLGDLERDFSQEQYIESIKKCIQYIRQGDMLQSNITMRFHGKYIGSPFIAYSKMREMTPNPYFSYFDFEEKLISTSPESFIRMDRGMIQSRPIKGTVKCIIDGIDQADFLKNSKKNRSENTMIADLIRNDIGRVCKIGSVKVPTLCEIKKYNNLYHLETVIEGKLKDNIRMSDVLRGNFPGGSITGAPKVRSMEIIDELEFTERGPYTGMIGFFGNAGYVNTSIGIRIVYFDKACFYIHAGGGIVTKSDPWDEYDELILKIEKIISVMNEFNILKSLRDKIDEYNVALLHDLSKRTEVIRKIKVIKEQYSIPINQPTRISSIIERMKNINESENLELDDSFIEKLFNMIIEESVRIEQLT